MIASELDMDNEIGENLRGDPKRQAVPSLQGYAYQIWQSLYRWLHLRTDQRVFSSKPGFRLVTELLLAESAIFCRTRPF
jgi:hypothetical protein